MEKGKFKENYQLFKKAWKDPKYKAIMKLSLYLIFIFILILMVKFCSNPRVTTTNTKPQELNSVQKIENTNNYEYTISINENQNITDIKGIKYQTVNDFEIINTHEKYTIKDNIIYKKINNEVVSNLLNINLNSLFLDNIKNYLVDDNLKNTIEYEGNEIKKEYYISNFNIFESEVSSNIILTTYENEDYVYKVEIDITEAIKTINPSINNYNITIEYNNINQIKNYQTN